MSNRCVKCQNEIAADAAFCPLCGAAQHSANWGVGGKVLRRSLTDYKIAGVCGGLAEYLGVDSSLVRVAWIVLSIVPGAIFLGLLAYVLAWLIMPPGVAVPGTVRAQPLRRLMRSATDQKVAGVCGGIAEYFRVDPTAVRLLWAILTVIPGAILGGVVAYIVAWIVMPVAPSATSAPAPAAQAGA